MEEYNRNPENRPLARTGSEPKDRKEEKQREDRKAEMNGMKGDFSEDDRTRPTGRTSALPGAQEEKDIGDKAAGAGLGDNKGRGTSTSDEFD